MEDGGAGVDWESLTEATSGAVGSLVSTTVLYPLDTCKSKLCICSCMYITLAFDVVCWMVYCGAGCRVVTLLNMCCGVKIIFMSVIQLMLALM